MSAIAPRDPRRPPGPAGVVVSGSGQDPVAGRSIAADRRLAEAGVLAVVVVWAANFVVVKAALAELPPVAFATLRFAVASVVLLALLRWREGSIRLDRADIPRVAAIGALGFGIYQVLWATALGSITAGDSALLIAATPVMTALIAAAIGSDTLTPAKGIGAVVSFAGVALVVASGSGLALGSSLEGDLLTILAALCWSLYTAFGAPILRRISALRMTAWAIVFGTLTAAPIGLLQLSTVDPAGVDPVVALQLLYSAVLPAGLANVVVSHAVRLLGPTRITTFQFLVPAVAVVLGALFLAEPIRAGQVAGGLVIVAGIAMSRRVALVPERFRGRGRGYGPPAETSGSS